jgi:hypothetical protein
MDTDQEDTRLDELREALRRAPISAVGPGSRTFEIKANDQYQQLSIDFTDLTRDNMNDWTTQQISALATDQIAALDFSSISLPPSTYQSGVQTLVQPTYNFSNDVLVAPTSGRLSLTGDNADIEINGESVVMMLKEIRDRLAILKVSEEMEAEWDELRDLRQQYESKLEECRSKSAVWKRLHDDG